MKNMSEENIKKEGEKIYNNNYSIYNDPNHVNDVININIDNDQIRNDNKTGVFGYFQKVLKKKKNGSANGNEINEKNEIIEIPPENNVYINIETSDLVCSICCVEYANDDDICILPCNYLHYYHKDCIFTWLKKNNDCPLCRKIIEKI